MQTFESLYDLQLNGSPGDTCTEWLDEETMTEWVMEDHPEGNRIREIVRLDAVAIAEIEEEMGLAMDQASTVCPGCGVQLTYDIEWDLFLAPNGTDHVRCLSKGDHDLAGLHACANAAIAMHLLVRDCGVA